ncbi:hypothetical protein AGMMS4956_16480 [Bacteroidia bacterium]|nr:hypothetical protein AGMMS4956_16480 [Bacteroidia bacterium]
MGILFVFSGFVKAIDPMGSAYKFEEYFEAFGWPALAPIALYLAIVLAVIELTLGLCMMARLRTQFTAWVALLFMLFFTALTLVLAITNAVTDCGCFGDAIVLSNWQTFYKNLIILPFVVVVFCLRNQCASTTNPVREWLAVVVLLGAGGMLSLYCLRHLPLIDFLPYHIGQNVPAAMTTPQGAPTAQYNVLLTYEKDGEQQQFAPEKSPWNDSTWTFVSSQSTLVSKGYVPPIHDFVVEHPQWGDITDSLLRNDYTLFVAIPKVSNITAEDIENLTKIAVATGNKKYAVVGLTTSSTDDSQQFAEQCHLPFDFCTVDATALKSTRLAPGVMLLHKGTIVAKWNLCDTPAPAFFEESILSNSINLLREQQEKCAVIICAFILFALLIALQTFVQQSAAKNRFRHRFV